MATFMNDLGQSALVKPILLPQALDVADPTGLSADLSDGDGACFAIQLLGAKVGTASLTGRIEESHDQTTWVAISGAVFAATPATQIVRFLRSRRFVRWAGEYEPGEGESIEASAIVMQCKKTT